MNKPNIKAHSAARAAPAPKGSSGIELGRYLAGVAGRNDRHTPGYAESAGNVPESTWFAGTSLGWRGPWGTTHPPNLRDKIPGMSEAQRVKFARTAQVRPPMPRFALRDMSETGLRAIYRFVVRVGPGNAPAPDYVPPNEEPKGPYVTFPAPPKQ